MAPTEAWRSPRRPFPAVQNLADVHITLQRGTGFFGCEGRNSYTLELNGSGVYRLSEWEASQDGRSRQRVSRTGSMEPRQFETLIQKFREAEFFSLRDFYGYDITDQGANTLTIVVGKQKAEVYDYVGLGGGMPSAVIRLQDEVDRVAGLEPWRCGRALAPFIQ